MRGSEEPQHVNFLELFFDLVFVVALLQLSHKLIEHLSWGGAARTFLLLAALWWTWTLTVWTTNLYDPREPAIQLLVTGTMLGNLVMVVALPDAYGERGAAFAGAYVTVHVGRQLFLVTALRGHGLQRRSLRALFWFGASAVPWILGVFASGVARPALWALALAADVTSGLLRFPTPRLGRSPESEYPILAEHLTERYRQFFIIALGELILVTTLTLANTGFAVYRTIAFTVSFVGTVLFWRIYVYRAAELLTVAIAVAADSDRLARWAGVTHLTMLAGIVATAVGTEVVIAHPLDDPRTAWVAVLLGGPALFLAGRAGFEYIVFSRVSWNRPVGILVLAALVPPMLHLPPLVTAIAAVVVLAGIALTDVLRGRRVPTSPTPPGNKRHGSRQ